LLILYCCMLYRWNLMANCKWTKNTWGNLDIKRLRSPVVNNTHLCCRASRVGCCALLQWGFIVSTLISFTDLHHRLWLGFQLSLPKAMHRIDLYNFRLPANSLMLVVHVFNTSDSLYFVYLPSHSNDHWLCSQLNKDEVSYQCPLSVNRF